MSVSASFHRTLFFVPILGRRRETEDEGNGTTCRRVLFGSEEISQYLASHALMGRMMMVPEEFGESLEFDPSTVNKVARKFREESSEAELRQMYLELEFEIRNEPDRTMLRRVEQALGKYGIDALSGGDALIERTSEVTAAARGGSTEMIGSEVEVSVMSFDLTSNAADHSFDLALSPVPLKSDDVAVAPADGAYMTDATVDTTRSSNASDLFQRSTHLNESASTVAGAQVGGEGNEGTVGSTGITAEQRERMERNRLEALERKRKKNEEHEKAEKDKKHPRRDYY